MDYEKLMQRVKDLECECQILRDSEQALIKNQYHLERLVNTVPCAIYDYIRFPDGQSEFLYFSPQCKKIFEYDSEQIIADNNLLWGMVYVEDLQRLQREDVEANQSKKIFKSEVRITLPSGGLKWIQLNSMPSSKNVTSQSVWSGVVLDITERKSMENKILEIKKLEATAILAGGIAHDFNNILTVITGHLQLALHGIGLDHKNSSNLQEALRASEKTHELTQKLLSFSSDGTLVKCKYSIEKLLRSSVASVILAGNYVADLTFAEDLWQVEVNAEQIDKVFTNILVNAKESMQGGGRLDISAENISSLANEPLVTQVATDSKFVKIVISDTGTGIADNIRHNIFNPYFSTKERGADKGIGIGLSVALSIVERHEGHIVVDSAENVGTSVCIYLPAVI